MIILVRMIIETLAKVCYTIAILSGTARASRDGTEARASLSDSPNPFPRVHLEKAYAERTGRVYALPVFTGT